MRAMPRDPGEFGALEHQRVDWTISVLPDMANAAISGLSKTGYKMPAANGKAMTL
jgi:hypothetical protein